MKERLTVDGLGGDEDRATERDRQRVRLVGLELEISRHVEDTHLWAWVVRGYDVIICERVIWR